MKDALTQRCLSRKQLGRFLSKSGSHRFNKAMFEHLDWCDDCREMVRKAAGLRMPADKELPLLALLFPEERPKTRGDCKDAARPCPWVGCRYHLWSDEHDDLEDPVGVEARVLAMPVQGAPSCALDVADEHPEGLLPTEVGRMLQMRPEVISAIEEAALVKIRKRGEFQRGDARSGEKQGMWERITEG
jgi:hypothetical protein